MKREIKFRGKSIDSLGIEKGKWVYGFLKIGKKFDDDDCQMHKIMYQLDDHYWADCKIDPETVGQFTGLKDRNGVEIYEGDILEYESREVNDENFITFKDGSFMLTKSDKTRFFPYCSEVIGNIHNNKDLLTKK